jgi:hypothetical protein
LGFRIGQSSGEWDVAISLYPADWPFAIFKVLMDEHLSINTFAKISQLERASGGS